MTGSGKLLCSSRPTRTPSRFTIRPGMPTTVLFGGTSDSTTAFEPILEFSPTVKEPEPCSGRDDDIVTKCRMPFALLFPRTPERHPVIQQHVVPDLARFPDHHTHAVVDEKPSADLRPRMNLYACHEAADLRNDSCDRKPALLIKPMPHPVRP